MADSQAATQPADRINSQSQLVPEPDSWAKLEFPDKEKFGCVWINKEYFKCGKLPDCDISTNLIKNSELLRGVSKTHFVIQKRLVRGASVAYIKDHSSNGTYINGELIGNGSTRILGHKDDISLVSAEMKVCRFFYLSADDQTALECPKQVRLDYHVMDFIGKGQFSQNYYVLNKKTHSPCVMKVTNNVSWNINKDDGNVTELRSLRGLKHANMISFHNHFVINSDLYLFVEYVDGVELSQTLQNQRKFSESSTRIIAKQIISALEYLHGWKIAHRSIRPKNILFNRDMYNPTVKIKNFKSCKKLRKGDASVETVGTTIYDAPETKSRAQSRYDVRVDVWSFGVLLYVCLCGYEPMEGRENNSGGKILYSPKDAWSGVSVCAKKVIEVSLVTDPKTRFHSAQVSKLPWFTVDLNQARKRPNILTNSNNALKKFKSNIC